MIALPPGGTPKGPPVVEGKFCPFASGGYAIPVGQSQVGPGQVALQINQGTAWAPCRKDCWAYTEEAGCAISAACRQVIGLDPFAPADPPDEAEPEGSGMSVADWVAQAKAKLGANPDDEPEPVEPPEEEESDG